VNLDDLLDDAAAQFHAQPDELEHHRRRQELTRFRLRSADPDVGRDLDLELELSAALDHVYNTARSAEDHGDLGYAATCLRIAADQGVGDACLHLARVLLRLGEYDEAAQWCAVSIEEGFTDATALLSECRTARREDLSNVVSGTLVVPLRNSRDEQFKQRQFYEHAAAVTVGAAIFDLYLDPTPTRRDQYVRLEVSQIEHVEVVTDALRKLDHQYGGVALRDIAASEATQAEVLMQTSCTDKMRARLAAALADLHMLAGWMSFDSDLVDEARTHFARALDLAKMGESEILVASILSRAGQMHMHHHAYDTALKLFQLGQLAAQNAGSPLDVALLCTQEAQAYYHMGSDEQALKLLGRARDELARVAPPSNDWDSVLATLDPRSIVADYLAAGLISDGTRGRAVALTALARKHLVHGNLEAAVRVGEEALTLADKLHSTVANEHLRQLKAEAERQPGTSGLVRRIVARLERAS
jgi:tetratricopeptide (TPR) repeat protein